METDKSKMNTLDLYRRILVRKKEDPSFDGRRAVNVLIRRMADELILAQASPLLNASVYVLGLREHLYCGHVYRLQRLDLDLRKHPGDMSAFDAAVLIRCLADLVSGGQIRNNVIYDAWYESFGTYGTNPAVSAERAFYLVQMIDSYLGEYERTRQLQKNTIPITKPEESSAIENQQRKPDVNDPLINDAKEKAEQIIKEAQEKANAIVEQAKTEASAIHADAQSIFEARMSEADQRVRQMKASMNLESFETSRNEINDSLKEIRRMINETGARLNQMDQKINDEMILKVFEQYCELYNLIADVAASIQKNMNEGGFSAVSAYQNHRIYLDMIAENLASLGIERLITPNGEAFDGRRHEAEGTQNFDPRSAIVKKSLRHGFVYGKTILKKELVEVEGGQ